MKYSFVITCLLALAPIGLIHAQDTTAAAVPTAECRPACYADQAEKTQSTEKETEHLTSLPPDHRHAP